MRTLALLGISALVCFGQTAKMVADPPTPTKPPFERALTDTEILKMQNNMLQVDRIQKEYKIQEFNEKVKSFSNAQQAQYVEACHSIGLTDADIAAQLCGYNIGVDLDGKPIIGADGKPMPARVWKIEPAKQPAK